MSENVLCVKKQAFEDAGSFQGLQTKDPQKYLIQFMSEKLYFMQRPEIETNFDYKQIIPYAVVLHRTDEGELSVFSYTRGVETGEDRLHEKVSIGVGGHINDSDMGEDIKNFYDAYRVGYFRELDEEVDIRTEGVDSLVGILNDDSNDVGKVHLGIVHFYWVKDQEVTAKEEGLLHSGFRTLPNLRKDFDKMENWSKIVFDQIEQWEKE